MNQIFSFSECPIYCDNLLLFVEEARLTFSNKLDPRYVIDTSKAIDVVAQDGMTVEIELSFSPLFQDPIYNSIINKQGINLNIGGMEFNGGFANNFTLQGNHGSPIKGSARMLFYDIFQGDFNPIQFQRTIYHEISNENFQIAHASMTELIQNLKIEIPMSFSYVYNSRFNPIYNVGSEKCQGIRMDRQTIQSSIVGDKIDNYISTFGNSAAISFSLKDICGDSLVIRRTKFNDESWNQEDTIYKCEGKITNFNTSVSPNDIIKTSVEVIQYL